MPALAPCRPRPASLWGQGRLRVMKGGGDSPPPRLRPPPQMGAGRTLAPFPRPPPPARHLRERPLVPLAPGSGRGARCGDGRGQLHPPGPWGAGRPPRWGRGLSRARLRAEAAPPGALPPPGGRGAPRSGGWGERRRRPPPPGPAPPRWPRPSRPHPSVGSLRSFLHRARTRSGLSRRRCPRPAPRAHRVPGPRASAQRCSPCWGRRRRWVSRNHSGNGRRGRSLWAGGAGRGQQRSSRGRTPCQVCGDRAARAMPAGTPPSAGAR